MTRVPIIKISASDLLDLAGVGYGLMVLQNNVVAVVKPISRIEFPRKSQDSDIVTKFQNSGEMDDG